MLRRHAQKRKAAHVTALHIMVNVTNNHSVNEVIKSLSHRLGEELKVSSHSVYCDTH